MAVPLDAESRDVLTSLREEAIAAPRDAAQATAPYFDALCGYAARRPGRFHVPGHKGGGGSDPQFREALGESAITLDIPLITPGVDVGARVTPLDQAHQLAAEAWGARRTW